MIEWVLELGNNKWEQRVWFSNTKITNHWKRHAGKSTTAGAGDYSIGMNDPQNYNSNNYISAEDVFEEVKENNYDLN